eukprot:SAG31_NODE_6460_length_2008_cov_2.676794_1_plen_69_part_00
MLMDENLVFARRCCKSCRMLHEWWDGRWLHRMRGRMKGQLARIVEEPIAVSRFYRYIGNMLSNLNRYV